MEGRVQDSAHLNDNCSSPLRCSNDDATQTEVLD